MKPRNMIKLTFLIRLYRSHSCRESLIRQGYWVRVRAYISKLTGGRCDGCADKAFPSACEALSLTGNQAIPT
jgi:hypothetical protein